MNIYKNIAAVLVAGLLAVGCSNAGDSANTTTGTSATLAAESATASAKPKVVMYKPPTCECCTGWAAHLRKAGFSVDVKKFEDMNGIKTKFGVTEKLASCHTAIVDGYVIEGHVPVADVERLLKERPDIVGLTAPGMPMKSPGMQAAGLPPQGYAVLAFDRAGNSTIYHQY